MNIPGAYSPLPATRAENPELFDDMIKPLPDGSTLRLVVIKEAALNKVLTNKVICYDDVEPSCIRNIGQPNEDIGYTYVLQSSPDIVAGPQNTIPCTLTYDDNDADKDNDVTEIISIKSELFPYTIPVTGEVERYYCVAISLAKRLMKESMTLDNDTKLTDVLKVTVRNQETFLCSNNHWDQTQVFEFKVPASVTEQAVISLKPIMHTTARIKITVLGDDWISSLKPGKSAF